MAQPLFPNLKPVLPAGRENCPAFSLSVLKWRIRKTKKHLQSLPPTFKMYLMHFWCISKLCSSKSLYHSFIYTPDTGTVSKLIQVPIHQASSDQGSRRPSARCWGWGKGSQVQNFLFFQKWTQRSQSTGSQCIKYHQNKKTLLITTRIEKHCCDSLNSFSAEHKFRLYFYARYLEVALIPFTLTTRSLRKFSQLHFLMSRMHLTAAMPLLAMRILVMTRDPPRRSISSWGDAAPYTHRWHHTQYRQPASHLVQVASITLSTGGQHHTQYRQPHRLNIWSWISKVYLGTMSRDVHSCTHWLRPRNPPHPLAFGLVYEGTIGMPRQTTSPCDPLGSHYQYRQSESKFGTFSANRQRYPKVYRGKKFHLDPDLPS